MPCKPIPLVAALLCAAASPAVLAAAPFATTADGRSPPLVATHAPSGTAGDAAPYGTSPDWQADIRLQVGSVALGDLNGDGLVDLAAGTYHSNSFPPYDDWHDYAWFNTGGVLASTPSWQSQDQHHTGTMLVGDIDRDGYNDLVAVRGGFSFDPSVVYAGSADGPSVAPVWQSQVSAWGVGATLVDIDGDGDLDLATANQGNSQEDPYRPMYLFRNDGGMLGTTPDWQSALASIQNDVAAGDLDGDALPELAAAKWVDFESAAYLNVAGTPATSPFWTAGSTDGDRGVAIADFDGDGRNDILLGQGVLTLYRNDGAGGFEPVWQAANADSDHQGLALADVNGDGWTDIAEVDFSRGKASLYLNHAGSLDPVPAWQYDGEGVGNSVAFGDVDGNGLPDLAIGFSGQPSVMLFLNTGTLPADDTIFADGFE
jgi:hypothetical protein